MLAERHTATLPAKATASVGQMQTILADLERDRADTARTVGLGSAEAMLLPLIISLARLAAQEDVRRMAR